MNLRFVAILGVYSFFTFALECACAPSLHEKEESLATVVATWKYFADFEQDYKAIIAEREDRKKLAASSLSAGNTIPVHTWPLPDTLSFENVQVYRLVAHLATRQSQCAHWLGTPTITVTTGDSHLLLPPDIEEALKIPKHQREMYNTMCHHCKDKDSFQNMELSICPSINYIEGFMNKLDLGEMEAIVATTKIEESRSLFLRGQSTEEEEELNRDLAQYKKMWDTKIVHFISAQMCLQQVVPQEYLERIEQAKELLGQLKDQEIAWDHYVKSLGF